MTAITDVSWKLLKANTLYSELLTGGFSGEEIIAYNCVCVCVRVSERTSPERISTVSFQSQLTPRPPDEDRTTEQLLCREKGGRKDRTFGPNFAPSHLVIMDMEPDKLFGQRKHLPAFRWVFHLSSNLSAHTADFGSCLIHLRNWRVKNWQD